MAAYAGPMISRKNVIRKTQRRFMIIPVLSVDGKPIRNFFFFHRLAGIFSDGNIPFILTQSCVGRTAASLEKNTLNPWIR
jgi:hypothetical protein